MAGYSITHVNDVPDVSGDYPGEIRMATEHIGAEQVALTYRRMAPNTGGKGSYGHRHRTQEETLYVISGTVEVKLEDEVVEAGPGTIVRIAPETLRSVWNEGPEDAELILVSHRLVDQSNEVELVDGFWPA
ncbi:MAG: cupin domain-containing protein [Thermoleophilaceae bacterium]|nr:cupin domain-containing protein [Thermoleophilaceae bacterium]